MTDNPYPVGTTVFAKLKGYPWWPARIESDDDLPENVSNKKPKQRPIWPVFFFGSYDYGWFGSSELKAFDSASAEKSRSAMRKANLLKTAYSEALNPSLITSRTDMDEPDEDDEDDEDDDSHEQKSTPARKKTAAKAKKATKAEPAAKKRRASATEDHPIKRRASKGAAVADKAADENESSKPTKRTSRAGLDSEMKSVDDDISATEASNDRTRKSDEDAGDLGESRAKKRLRSGQPSERLLKLRHKLQKLLLVEGLSDEVLTQNLERADPILAEVEAFDIDLQMLKDTKVGRLMKKISALQFRQDPHKIVERSMNLIKQYKAMMERAQENGEGLSSAVKAAETISASTRTIVSFPEHKTEVATVAATVAATQSPIVPAHILDVPPTPAAVVAAVAAIVETNTLVPPETGANEAAGEADPSRSAGVSENILL
ncbi:hypothetical protein BGX28_002460 [Mortierella sp. GBA30]|nr:hypothetical protein BGX28_002460 [Mortierella sp. GBA30]